MVKNFINIYENRIVKPVRIPLKGVERMRKSNTGSEFYKIHCMHIEKYHNLTPLYN
jgi:hypothetical protein